MKKQLTYITGFIMICTSLSQAQNPILWGMTQLGGAKNEGNIFSFNSSLGIETDIHDFGIANDGQQPNGDLIQAVNGLLYGMSYQGGSSNDGVIFSYNISTDKETVIFNFNGISGANPSGSLIQVSDSTLYGLTAVGGSKDYGVIFKYNILTGKETVLYNFASEPADGKLPYGTLTLVNDSLLYGMTGYGGVYDSTYGGDGTIFSYNISSRKYAKLHDFKNNPDGENPLWGSLLDVGDSALYGMTQFGGGSSGTLFKYSIKTGLESVVHFFGSGNDGSLPKGSLIQLNDSLLYGMTSTTGVNFGGIIFSFNLLTEKENILYSFGGTDGKQPGGSLKLASNGLLYGMTSQGGANDSGTIFSYNILTNAEIDINNFTGANGSFGWGDLIEVDTPVSVPTGINQLSVNSNQLSIYPNPNSGEITVASTKTIDAVTITNLLGQTVLKSSLGDLGVTQFTLELKNEGMYFVTVTEDGETTTKEVIVSK